jgi:mycofactocin biosynthesis protein MftB
MGCAASTEGGPPAGGLVSDLAHSTAVGRLSVAGFDPSQAWRLAPQVSIRPERLGGLVYHYGTRRLTFVKNRKLLDVVQGMDAHPSVLEACEAAGVTAQELPRFVAALESLAQTGAIVRSGEMVVQDGAW